MVSSFYSIIIGTKCNNSNICNSLDPISSSTWATETNSTTEVAEVVSVAVEEVATLAVDSRIGSSTHSNSVTSSSPPQVQRPRELLQLPSDSNS